MIFCQKLNLVVAQVLNIRSHAAGTFLLDELSLLPPISPSSAVLHPHSPLPPQSSLPWPTLELPEPGALLPACVLTDRSPGFTRGSLQLGLVKQLTGCGCLICGAGGQKSGKEEEDRGSLARLEGRQARLSQCRVFTPEEFHSISSTTEA